MNNSLVLEYKKMQTRYEKLISEEKELHKEHQKDVRYFVKHHIFDKEWQEYLERTACNLASASLRIKIAEEKMEQIRTILFPESIDYF